MADFTDGDSLGPGQPVDRGHGQAQIIRVQGGGHQCGIRHSTFHHGKIKLIRLEPGINFLNGIHTDIYMYARVFITERGQYLGDDGLPCRGGNPHIQVPGL